MSNCGENCGCNEKEATKEKKCNCKESISKLKQERDDANDKYIRLYAEFDNYKKRNLKEREEVVEYAKTKALVGVLDLNDDLAYARKFKTDSKNDGLDLIMDKLSKFITSQGIQEIQTEVYNADLHEVVSTLPVGEEKIVDVLTKGYTLNGKVIKYPKIILGTK